jgi:hypothetical protein
MAERTSIAPGGNNRAFCSLFDRKTHNAVAIIFERISIWRIYHPFGIELQFQQKKS